MIGKSSFPNHQESGVNAEIRRMEKEMRSAPMSSDDEVKVFVCVFRVKDTSGLCQLEWNRGYNHL